MPTNKLKELVDKDQTLEENLKRLSVRMIQLESLVSIQSEIINYITTNNESKVEHPLMKMSKELHKTLMPANVTKKSGSRKKSVKDDSESTTAKMSETAKSDKKSQMTDNDAQSISNSEAKCDRKNSRRNSSLFKSIFKKGSRKSSNANNAYSFSVNEAFDCSPPAVTSPKLRRGKKTNHNAGGGDGFSDDTQFDISSSLSSDLEVEIEDPPKPFKVASKSLGPLETYPNAVCRHQGNGIHGPIVDDPELLQWVSNQQNNNRRSYITRFNSNHTFLDKKDAYRNDVDGFVNACKLLEESLKSPKSICTSKLVEAMTALREFWFHNATDSTVTVESFSAILKILSRFPNQVVRRVVNQRDEEKRTFLHLAVQRRRWSLIETALEECSEFDLDLPDSKGNTALMLMIFHGSKPMGAEEHAVLDSLVRRSSEATRTEALLVASAATTAHSSHQNTNNSLEGCGYTAVPAVANAVVTRLCARGTHLKADPRDALGNTALMLAIRSGNHEVAKTLLLLRPDLCELQERDQSGRTVLDLAKLYHASPEVMRLIRYKVMASEKGFLPTRRRR